MSMVRLPEPELLEKARGYVGKVMSENLRTQGKGLSWTEQTSTLCAYTKAWRDCEEYHKVGVSNKEGE